MRDYGANEAFRGGVFRLQTIAFEIEEVEEGSEGEVAGGGRSCILLVFVVSTATWMAGMHS